MATEAKRYVRPLVSALIIGASIAGLYNVMGDDADLRRRASAIACGDDEQRTPTQGARYPFLQRYVFQCRSAAVQVTCTRAAYLVGPYACVKDR
ncbi:MAG TPA: hypothetical protein PLU22_17050 [Polyangiaceae bacterium]|nr:hypothetical protein [Polyangiaceae bacterium]